MSVRAIDLGLPGGNALVYRDDGCAQHPACLTCPFEECIAGHGSAAVIRGIHTRKEVLHLASQGLSSLDIASTRGITRTHVYRILREAKE